MTRSGEVARKQDVAEAELRIGGDHVVPSMVRALVGVSPSRAWAKGEPYPAPRSKQILERHSGLWAVTCKDATVEGAAQSLLKLMEPHVESMRAAAAQSQGSVSVAIWWDPAAGQGGFTLDSDIVKRLAELGERIDFYFPG